MVNVIKKFGFLLSKHQKIRVLELSILMIVGGLLETFSVSLILPFINAALNPAETMENRYVKWICDVLDIHTSIAFIVFMSIVLAILYLVKNIYLMVEYNIQYRFVYGNMFVLQRRLLNAFIHRPYEYFLNANSGELIRIISGDTVNAFNLLITLLSLLTELVVSMMLIMAIFVITPLITFFVALLLICLLVFIYLVVKPVLRRAGLNMQKSAAQMNKWLIQSIQGIKEIKVTEKEQFFEKKYSEYGQVFVKSLRWNTSLGAAPRFIIEGVSMGAMFIVVAVLIGMGYDLQSIIPMLTAVAMASIRLLPSVNRISTALSQIAYGEPMLDKVIENVHGLEENYQITGTEDISDKDTDNKNTFDKDIVINDISYHYPNAEKNVLSEASMVIEKGESVGIMGQSGSGKTTTVDILLGLLNPQRGEILIDGNSIIVGTGEDRRIDIGYIPQSIFMLDDTIRANIAFGINKDEISEGKVWRALREAALEEFVNNLPQGLDTEIGERGVRLSGGQRQRIGIARALYGNPDVLILDEATSALDYETENEIMKSINGLRGKKTLIIIAHRLSTLEYCDRIYKVENGKIIAEICKKEE